MSHVVYVLECSDGSYYTGYTTDLERRVAQHRAGDGAKYTRGRTPLSVVHVERYGSRSAAMSREHEVKQLSRGDKEDLVEGSGEVDLGGSGEVDLGGSGEVDLKGSDEGTDG